MAKVIEFKAFSFWGGKTGIRLTCTHRILSGNANPPFGASEPLDPSQPTVVEFRTSTPLGRGSRISGSVVVDRSSAGGSPRWISKVWI